MREIGALTVTGRSSTSVSTVKSNLLPSYGLRKSVAYRVLCFRCSGSRGRRNRPGAAWRWRACVAAAPLRGDAGIVELIHLRPLLARVGSDHSRSEARCRERMARHPRVLRG